MSLDRRVQQALEEARDPTSALLWRRVCHDLSGPVTVGLVASDEAALAALRCHAAALHRDDVHLVEIPLDDDGDRPSLGAEDRLLACHIVCAATPYPRALGSQERARLATLSAVSPSHRRVVLVGRELLDRLSDRPAEEADEVQERARAVAPEGWPVLSEEALEGWILPLVADRSAITHQRQQQVARLLLHSVLEGVDEERVHLLHDHDTVSTLLEAEDDALDAARREARRTAAHVLAAVRRHTDSLVVELRAFLTELERDVPEQAEGVPSADVLRRTLPHWLHHVVEDWLTERLDRWRVELAADLEEVGIDRAIAERAELVVPAMAPGPVHADDSWTSRLGATAAVGGGAALLIAGLWFPALLALTGGIAWSSIGRAGRDAESRRNVVAAAVEALRTMAADAERLLADQIQHIEGRLAELEAEAADDHVDARQGIRTRLVERHAASGEALAELDARRSALWEMLSSLEAETP